MREQLGKTLGHLDLSTVPGLERMIRLEPNKLGMDVGQYVRALMLEYQPRLSVAGRGRGRRARKPPRTTARAPRGASEPAAAQPRRRQAADGIDTVTHTK